MTRIVVFWGLSLFLIGCSHTEFRQDRLRDQLDQPRSVSGTDVRTALELRPQLPKPFRLGVYFQGPENNYAKWVWTEADKKQLLTVTERLGNSRQLKEIFLVGENTVDGGDIGSFRLAAARHGAHALLVVNGKENVDSHTNDWAFTYIALVTTLFVPASEIDVHFFSRAAMWDVGNEYLYLTAEAESAKNQTRPAAFTDERKVLADAKQESMLELRDRLASLLVEFEAAPPRS